MCFCICICFLCFSFGSSFACSFVYLIACLLACFTLFSCVHFHFILFSFFLYARLFSNDREQEKNMDFGEWRSGEDHGGVGGEGTIIRMYCYKKNFKF